MIELLTYLILIFLNGLFAMSEVALLAADKYELKRLSKSHKGAKYAYDLSQQPNRFLATVQISITMIGIIAGIYGGLEIATPLINLLEKYDALALYAEPISFALVTILSTYLFLVFGELVPKRIALASPTKISQQVSSLMYFLAKIFHPITYILSASVNFILTFLKIAHKNIEKIEDQDIIDILYEGTSTGVFLKQEKTIIENTLQVGDMKVKELTTPIPDISWFNSEESPEDMTKQLLTVFFEELPVAKGSLELENVLGVVKTKDLLKYAFKLNEYADMHQLYYPARIVSEDTPVLNIIPMFNKMEVHIIFVKDANNNLTGIITIWDVLDALGGIV